jgi:hypothetical protein
MGFEPDDEALAEFVKKGAPCASSCGAGCDSAVLDSAAAAANGNTPRRRNMVNFVMPTSPLAGAHCEQ